MIWFLRLLHDGSTKGIAMSSIFNGLTLSAVIGFAAVILSLVALVQSEKPYRLVAAAVFLLALAFALR